MTPRGGISGTGVAITVAGMLLIYGGFLGTSPLEVLRRLSSGTLPSAKEKSSTVTGASGTVVATSYSSSFVAGCQQFAADHYSETRRNQAGYSDCSSFICKGLRAAGVQGAFPGGWPRTTITLKTWSAMHRTTSAMQPGDLAISDTDGYGAHVVMITGAGQAIGQQNSRVNVQSGALADLMTVPYHIYRFSPASTTIGA